MTPKRKTALYIAALLALNSWIMARVFKTEYSPFLSSIEGAYIGISRWLITHWQSPGWFPLWYAGIPVENTYPPLLHFLVAFASMATGMSVVRSHHVVSASFYCLAPVTLFWLVRRLTQSEWKAFAAGWVYSLISVSAILMQSVRVDVGTALGARKMQALVYYGEGPHVTAITLLFAALAAVDAAIEGAPGWRTVLAVVLSAAVALTNWLGAMALVCGVLALAISKDRVRMPAVFRRIALIGALAYAVAVPWVPPSDIAAVQRNSQLVGDFPMGHAKYLYLAAWLAVAFVIGLVLQKMKMPQSTRFALLFLFLMAVPPLGYELFKIYPLPQPERYHLEMDAAFAMVVGMGLGSARLASGRTWQRAVVVLLLVGLAIMQAPRWRKEVRAYLPAFDITKTVERAQALWLGSHYPGQRVFLVGSTGFWLNAFADNPQLGGGFDQGRSNPAIAGATYAIPYIEGRGGESVALLKAYGVRAIAVGGKNSRDAYRNYRDPAKFVGVVPEVWRDGDDAIYDIPGTGSLTHVVKKSELVRGNPLNWRGIERFAAALDADTSGTRINWDGPNHGKIRATLKDSEVLSVQMNWDAGWAASANGTDLTVGRDALGLMVLEPKCDAGCTVDLVYDGGTQGKIARLLCVIGIAGCGFMLYRGGKTRS